MVSNNMDQPYMIFPRPSISKTPLRMANSLGLIDPGYRGELKVSVDNPSDDDYSVSAGSKLFQVVSFHGGPISIEIVSSHDPTERNEGGVGSIDVKISCTADSQNSINARDNEMNTALLTVPRIGIDVVGVISIYDFEYFTQNTIDSHILSCHEHAIEFIRLIIQRFGSNNVFIVNAAIK